MSVTTSNQNARPWPAVAAAVALTTAALSVGYWALGLATMLIFTAGFVGGLLLWRVWPSGGGWADIRAPYWIALLLFLAHRVEEKQMGFFAFLAAVTGVPTPAVNSVPVVLLVAVSAGAWLLIPALMRRGRPIGRYLAWTFFASLGLTELAHFVVFPWLDPGGAGYVPGMWTVVALAPVAWWGMWRLSRRPSIESAPKRPIWRQPRA
ncbi:hypothetical protein ACXYX3_28250 (plasmid) [Mycobacterium sp. C3-094]|uniref:hypothetical protein n=1 Tax=Mycobacteriaceae TaxID=1762 RepID=UPI000A76A262|nr:MULTISPECIES: hypothetical protein [Mycobacteriaceae]MCG7594871.1 hypothetical protein [Mycobacterium sp. PSTR-4-N]